MELGGLRLKVARAADEIRSVKKTYLASPRDTAAVLEGLDEAKARLDELAAAMDRLAAPPRRGAERTTTEEP